jgi:hypothetical protein
MGVQIAFPLFCEQFYTQTNHLDESYPLRRTDFHKPILTIHRRTAFGKKMGCDLPPERSLTLM